MGEKLLSGRAHSPQDMALGQLLAMICRLTGDRLRVKMERIGLHRGQGFLLMHLCHRDGVSQQEIARAKHVSPATVTNMLKRMERDGWIERRRDERDERIVRVYATEKARAMHDEASLSLRELDQEVTAALTDSERQAFRSMLEKIHARLLETSVRHGRPYPEGPATETNAGHGDSP